jgi:hypothetical protein
VTASVVAAGVPLINPVQPVKQYPLTGVAFSVNEVFAG